MLNYTEPKIEIILFEEEDIIRTSGDFSVTVFPSGNDDNSHDTPFVGL